MWQNMYPRFHSIGGIRLNNYLSALSVAVLSFILLLVPLMVVDAEGTVDVTIHHPDNGHLYLKDCSGSEQTFDGYTLR